MMVRVSTPTVPSTDTADGPPPGAPRRDARWVRPLLVAARSEEHTSELQSHVNLVCRLLLEKKKTQFAPTARCLKMAVTLPRPRDPHHVLHRLRKPGFPEPGRPAAASIGLLCGSYGTHHRPV